MCTDYLLSLPSLPHYTTKKHWEIVLMMSFSGTYLMKERSEVHLVTVISGLSLSDPLTLSCIFVFLLNVPSLFRREQFVKELY